MKLDKRFWHFRHSEITSVTRVSESLYQEGVSGDSWVEVVGNESLRSLKTLRFYD